MSDERRNNERFVMNLPVSVKVASGETIELELVDISSTGMRVQGDTLSLFEQRPGANNKRLEFEIRVSARLAWVEVEPDGTIALGLDMSDSESD